MAVEAQAAPVAGFIDRLRTWKIVTLNELLDTLKFTNAPAKEGKEAQ